MMSGSKKGTKGLESGTMADDSPAPMSLFRGVLGSILTGALIASLIMLGGCYRQNMALQQRLAGGHMATSSWTFSMRLGSVYEQRQH
jgi:hypothetical protein